jgi:hypothetical protein
MMGGLQEVKSEARRKKREIHQYRDLHVGWKDRAGVLSSSLGTCVFACV